MMVDNNFNVLVVDDEPDVLELIKYNLTHKGLCVSVARNGEHALEMLGRTQPHVFILDIMMPVMNGIELSKKLRMIPEYRKTPILFLSASNDDVLILSAMHSGGDHFVSKPINLNMLFRIVSELHGDFQRKESASSGTVQ